MPVCVGVIVVNTLTSKKEAYLRKLGSLEEGRESQAEARRVKMEMFVSVATGELQGSGWRRFRLEGGGQL